jgi:hypothetical protein
MHQLRRPVGFTGTRQASAPAPGVRLEVEPVGRCPRPFPRAPTLEDSTILGLIMAFCRTVHDTAIGRASVQTGKI